MVLCEIDRDSIEGGERGINSESVLGEIDRDRIGDGESGNNLDWTEISELD